MQINRIVIVGAGAIGGCVGGLLCNSANPVALVARGEHGAKIRDGGLNVVFPNRSISCSLKCFESVEQVDWSEEDVCLIATKLNDAEAVMDQLLKTCGPNLPIVCAFNGLQGEKWAASRFENVATIMIWMPSTHLFPGDVRVYGDSCPGVLDIGPVKGKNALTISETIARMLEESGFESIARPDILLWKYAKWITNLGNTAQALISDDWKGVAKAAQAEGELVLEAAGIERVKTDELLERCKKVNLKPIDGERRAGGSTWQSFMRGKKLETQWIEGAMARLADEIGVSAPVNHKLAALASDYRTAQAREVL